METYHIKVRRSAGGEKHWDFFEISMDSRTTLLDLLGSIQRNPVDQKGQECQPVAFESGCQKGQCGRCMVLLDGSPVLMCQTRAEHLPKSFCLEPLDVFPVVRDLVVDKTEMREPGLDLQPVLSDLKYYKNYSPSDPDRLDMGCIDCGACLQVCPQYESKSSFEGAYSALKFFEDFKNNPDQSRALINQSTLEKLVSVCDGAMACVKACPQEIPLNEVWGFLKRKKMVSIFELFR